MAGSDRSALRVLRGLLGALVGGSCGAVIVLIFASAAILYRWHAGVPTGSELQHDLKGFQEILPPVLLRAVAVFACAGWATYAPRGKWTFFGAFWFIFLPSLAVWIVCRQLDLIPSRKDKSIEHPILYPFELVASGVIPVLAAALLTIIRIQSFRMNKGHHRLTLSDLHPDRAAEA